MEEIRIEDHLKLVRMVISKNHAGGKFIMKKCGCEYDDIYQVGCIGLMKAIRDFNPSKGFKFTTYASVKINGEIRRYYRDNFSMVRFGRTCNEIAYKINQMELPAHMITTEFIMKEFDVKKVVASDVIDYMNSAIDSLDATAEGKDDYDMSFHEFFADESIEDFNKKMELQDYFSILNEREEKIFKLHLDDISQIDIGKIVGLSQMHVSRELKRIKKKLKEYNQKAVSI